MTADSEDLNAIVKGARAEFRERQIVEAAIRLMQKKGTHSVSMQAIAKSAGVSVGLLYKYFSDKEQIVLAAITRVLEEFRLRIPAAIAKATDHVDKVIAAFSEFCRIVDEQRHAVVLTYQVSKSLSKEGLQSIQAQELETLQPLVDVAAAAIDAGKLRNVDAQTLGHDLMVIAHMWALKHWYFQRIGVDLDAYISQQVRTVVLSNTEASAKR